MHLNVFKRNIGLSLLLFNLQNYKHEIRPLHTVELL